MDNLLSSIINKAAKSILQGRLALNIPEFPNINDEIQKMKDAFNKEDMKEELKHNQEEIQNRARDAMEESKQAAIDLVSNCADNMTQAMDEIKSDLMDLGTSAGLLITGTAEFLSRIALIPPAIIVTTPLGPGVATNMIPPMLKDLKAEGDNLSKIYDDCTSKMNKLGLLRLSNLEKSRLNSELINLIDFESISNVISIVEGAQTTAKPFILAVGASVDGDMGSEPEVDPPIEIEYSAKDCSNFSYIIAPPDPEIDPGDISVNNCSNYIEMISGQGKSCTNCKNYKGRIS